MEQQPAAPTAPDRTQTLSFAQKLRNGDRYWAYKMGLRTVLCVAMSIGVGTTAWLVKTAYGSSEYGGRFFGYIYSMDYIIMPFALPVIALSLIWSLITILVPLLRKSHRPVHPGTAVSFDLLLWLALIVTGLFTIVCLYQLNTFGAYGRIDDQDYNSSEYSGHYKHLSNGTWVWKLDYVSSSYRDPGYHYNTTTGNYTYSQGHTAADIKRDCSPFRSCEREDELINQLWHQKQHRYGIELVATVVQFVGVVLHFVLFVWACVDTHRRNHNVKERIMREAANEAIRDMQARGMITIHDPTLAGRTAGGAEMSQVREGEAGPSVVRQQAPG